MNADLQDPPEMIPQFIQKWESGYEIVHGVIQKREGVNIIRRVLSRIAYMIIFKLSNNLIPENFLFINILIIETILVFMFLHFRSECLFYLCIRQISD